MFIAEKVANRESGKNYAIFITECDGEQIANSMHKEDAELICKLLNNHHQSELFGKTEQVEEEEYFLSEQQSYENEKIESVCDVFALETMKILLQNHINKNDYLKPADMHNISNMSYEMADYMIFNRDK